MDFKDTSFRFNSLYWFLMPTAKEHYVVQAKRCSERLESLASIVSWLDAKSQKLSQQVQRDQDHIHQQSSIFTQFSEGHAWSGVAAFSEASTFGCTPTINYPGAYKKNLSPNPSQAF